jgi:isopentenyldiphosphate isomerase
MQKIRQENTMSSSSNSNKATKRSSSVMSNEKQVEVSGNRGTEEEEDQEETVISVTNQLFIKPKNLDKEVILRRIRHRKRMNKVRSVVGAIFQGTSNNNTGNDEAAVQHKKWVDDAFAAL